MAAFDLDRRTVALSAFRELPDGRVREYSATTFTRDPWLGCNHILRMAKAVGFVTAERTPGAYAMLDAIDQDGDILQSFAITSARAFRWFYRKLHWRVEDEDGPRAVAAFLRQDGDTDG